MSASNSFRNSKSGTACATMATDETIGKFKLLGLSEQKAKETLKNGNVTKFLLAALNKVRIPSDFNFG